MGSTLETWTVDAQRWGVQVNAPSPPFFPWLDLYLQFGSLPALHRRTEDSDIVDAHDIERRPRDCSAMSRCAIHDDGHTGGDLVNAGNEFPERDIDGSGHVPLGVVARFANINDTGSGVDGCLHRGGIADSQLPFGHQEIDILDCRDQRRIDGHRAERYSCDGLGAGFLAGIYPPGVAGTERFDVIEPQQL